MKAQKRIVRTKFDIYVFINGTITWSMPLLVEY
jgi:hypothetical protein